MAGDVFITVSLAGSLFFDVGVGAARPKVVLYLLLTMAPFAVVAPVIGPFLDRTRGGRRLMVALSMAGRAALCLLMADHIKPTAQILALPMKLNVSAENLQAVLAVLPSMRAPTISELSGGDAFALETVVAKSDINVLIPALRDHGASPVESYYWCWHKEDAIRTADWRMHRFCDHVELYDIHKDVGETVNVADKHPEVVAA